jgi:hypothetical protein
MLGDSGSTTGTKLPNVVLAQLIAANAETWTGILVAALGSSALGAIVGGYLTTRLQGRHEREEAWRNRLIEAVHAFNGQVVKALTDTGGLLPGASRGEYPLRGEDGNLTEPAAGVVGSTAVVRDEMELALAHLELLVGTDSDVYQHAYSALRAVRMIINLLEGRPRATRIVEAAVRERQSPGAGITLLPDDRAFFLFDLLRYRPEPPEDFDPLDDMSVAQWAREVHHAGGDSAHRYMEAAHGYIEGYRLA